MVRIKESISIAAEECEYYGGCLRVGFNRFRLRKKIYEGKIKNESGILPNSF